MGRRVLVALVAGFLLLASCAPARADWTIAAFLGAAATRNSTLRIIQPASGTNLRFEPIDYRSESFTPPVYYGYRVGWIPPQLLVFAIEAEFIHLKAFADTSAVVSARGLDQDVFVNRQQRLDDTVQRFSVSHGVNFVLVNLVWRIELDRGPGEPRAALAIRGGFGVTVPHGESTIRGVSQEQYELGRYGSQAGVGLEIRLMKGLHAIGEYKLTRTNQQVSVSGGEAQTLLRTNHLVFGAGYRF